MPSTSEYADLTAHVAETATAPAEGQHFIRDNALPGFGLRITSKGLKLDRGSASQRPSKCQAPDAWALACNLRRQSPQDGDPRTRPFCRRHRPTNLAMRLLRAIFNYAIGRYEDGDGNPVVIDNPVLRLSAVRAWYRIDRRRTLIRLHQMPAWFDAVEAVREKAGTGQYPGGDTIAGTLGLLKTLTAETENVALIEQFLSRKNDLLDLADDIHELRHFFAHQRQAWDQLLDAKQRFKANRHELEQNASAAAALKRIQDILHAPSPYGMAKEAAGLIHQIEQVNDALIAAHRAQVLPEVDKQIDKVQIELETAQAADGRDQRQITQALRQTAPGDQAVRARTRGLTGDPG